MRPLMAFACLGTIAGSLVLIPATQVAGRAIAVYIETLIDTSERIVLVKVESVQDGPDQKIRRARATVKEVWKGPKVETVEYRLTPQHDNDNPQAVPGEIVLLFLVKEGSDWKPAWAGFRWRTLETQDSKEYLCHGRVIFPAGISSVTFPKNREGRFDRGVELKIVKELVDKAIADKKK